jgi:hypothetical protein
MILLIEENKRVIMAVQTIYFFFKMVVWAAPISALLKLIGIGTVQVTIQENKIETWAS